jgi:hypothetical protein
LPRLKVHGYVIRKSVSVSSAGPDCLRAWNLEWIRVISASIIFYVEFPKYLLNGYKVTNLQTVLAHVGTA